jgi:hypothetical protein
MNRHGRFRLDRIEHTGAARHRAGVPVLELAAGDQHHRILASGRSSGGMMSAGTNFARPSASGNAR